MVRERAPQLFRVYGSTYNAEENYWFFPAYAPFGPVVLDDLKKVAPDVTYSAEVVSHIEFLRSVPELVKNRVLPELSWKTFPPFEHQTEGLSFLYYNPRSALFWDMGTGKSRVIVDLIRLHKGKRFLIITPKVTLLNWVKEFTTHAGDEIKVRALKNDQAQKRRSIRDFEKYDVLVMSYGTARNLGLPKVFPKALRRLKEALELKLISENMAQALGRAVRRLSDSQRQEDMVWAKLFGATLPEVERAIADEVTVKGPQWLEDLDFYGVIADESHNIKDMRSVQSKAIVSLSRRAARRHLMSGTPTYGNPLHLYPQLRFLANCLVPEDWLRFSDKFLVRSKWNKRIITGFQNLNLLNARVQRVAINKTKEECLDLPPRLPPIDIQVDLSDEQVKLYNALVSEMEVDLSCFFQNGPQRSLEAQNAAVLLNKLAQVGSGFLMDSGQKEEICNGCEFLTECVEKNFLPYTPACRKEQTPRNRVLYTEENPKLEALNELLDTLLEEGEDAHGNKISRKVIIWAVFHAEMNLIEKALQDRDVGYVRVDGSTGMKVQRYVDKFNEDPKTRVYLGQIATGIGITLNAATYTIYYTLDWSLGSYLQSIDRNYRAGQTKKVTVYRLIGKGTVDEYKAAALDEKRDIGAVLTSKLTCATCTQRIDCLKLNIELFDPKCKYQRSTRRTIAHPETI